MNNETSIHKRLNDVDVSNYRTPYGLSKYRIANFFMKRPDMAKCKTIQTILSTAWFMYETININKQKYDVQQQTTTTELQITKRIKYRSEYILLELPKSKFNRNADSKYFKKRRDDKL